MFLTKNISFGVDKNDTVQSNESFYGILKLLVFKLPNRWILVDYSPENRSCEG